MAFRVEGNKSQDLVHLFCSYSYKFTRVCVIVTLCPHHYTVMFMRIGTMLFLSSKLYFWNLAHGTGQ